MAIDYQSLTSGVTKWASMVLYCEAHNLQSALLELISPEVVEPPAPAYNPNTPRSRSGGASIVANKITASTIVMGDMNVVNNVGGGPANIDLSALTGLDNLGAAIQHAVRQAVDPVQQPSQSAPTSASPFDTLPPEASLSSGSSKRFLIGIDVSIGSGANADVVIAKRLTVSSGASVGKAFVEERVRVGSGANIDTLQCLKSTEIKVASGASCEETYLSREDLYSNVSQRLQ